MFNTQRQRSIVNQALEDFNECAQPLPNNPAFLMDSSDMRELIDNLEPKGLNKSNSSDMGCSS